MVQLMLWGLAYEQLTGRQFEIDEYLADLDRP